MEQLIVGILIIILVASVGSILYHGFNWLVDRRIKQQTDKLYKNFTYELSSTVSQLTELDAENRYRVQLLGWELREYLKEHGSMMSDPAMPTLPRKGNSILVHEQREAGKRVAEYQRLIRLDKEQVINASRAEDV